MQELFIEKDFRGETLTVIALVSSIMAEYAEQGYDLSLRQLYYQLVARGYLENSQREYNRLGRVVGDARLAGLLDWDGLVDRGRQTLYPGHWQDPAEIVDEIASVFRVDRWEDQPSHVEVMVEKDALSGVLEPVCRELDVRFTANRGYSSLSHLYRIGKRIRREWARKNIFVLYLGDHDPSGLDMDRDITERLELFSGVTLKVLRLGLTMKQIEALKPPENPTKLSDSRAEAYIAKFGYSSWELDALEPAFLADLVRGAVAIVRDDELYDAALEREKEMRTELEDLASSYREG